MRAGGGGCHWLGLALAVAACDPPPTPGPQLGSSTASSTASVLPSASAPPVRPRVPAATSSGCRILGLSGEVKQGGEPLANGAVVYGTAWLELGKDASLTLRHTVSTREVTLKGPGAALPCLDGEEDVLLAAGTFVSTAGPGARPGAEVVVFTPLGTVSYGDAQITVRASKTKVDVSSTKGEAWVLPAQGATRKGPEKAGGPNDKPVLTGPGTIDPLVKECERAAEQAEGLARAVLGPATGDGGTLGERAAAHLGARKAARRACGAARAGARTEPDTDKRSGFERRVQEASRRWRSLGVPGEPAAKSSAE